MQAKSTWKNDGFWDLFPNLLRRRDTKAGVLSGGEQQMLTMCRSLLSNPDHRDMVLTDVEKALNERIAVCCSRSKTKTLRLQI